MSLVIENITGGVSILFDPLLEPGEFITKVGLNFTDPSLSTGSNPIPDLNVSCTETGGGTICSNFNSSSNPVVKVNGYSIEGSAVDGFDLGFDFALKNNNDGRLTNDQTVTFSLTGLFDPTGTALTTADLLGTIVLNSLEINVAAKVQGISNGGSGVIADPLGNGTPVPGPLPLLGAVAAFQASRRLRRRLKPTAAAAPRSA